MEIYELNLQHRNGDNKHFVFCDYASARRYANELKQYSTLLNGFTIRQLKLDKTNGVFNRSKVMYHIHFTSNGNIDTLTNCKSINKRQ